MAKLRENALRRLVGLDPFPQPPLIRTQNPIVLMHGFGMMGGLMKMGHLHDEAMDLRLHGVLAYAPNVVPYNTVAVRAAMWQDRLTHILAETGAQRLNLIAHSMGGLDARYLISVMGLHDMIASLVTVATPHRGTSIAAILLDQPDRVRQWAVDLANWLGTKALDEGDADALQALSELTPEHVNQSFNPAVPDHPEVRYWSYAGKAGKDTGLPINPFLKLGNSWIYQREGCNDGLVSESSAQWGTFLGTIDADHAQQVGLQGLPGNKFDAKGFYRSIATMLAQEGF